MWNEFLIEFLEAVQAEGVAEDLVEGIPVNTISELKMGPLRDFVAGWFHDLMLEGWKEATKDEVQSGSGDTATSGRDAKRDQSDAARPEAV